ncbi:hypothetical protein [Paenibacillus sp. P36]|uniref:barstar family protein n=1 Tax=Paenibacillus sp. P36 TaxID=3342538 RepID=UPI0038B23406
MNKYLLVEDENNLIIGECNDIIGFLDGRKKIACYIYEITFVGLQFRETYIQHCLTTKSRMGGMHIHILSQGKEPIGEYFFVPEKPYRFNKEDAANRERINLTIFGGFATTPSIEASEIWNKWVTSKPLTSNNWVALTQKQRKGWMEVVRLHSLFNQNRFRSVEENHFYLDMTNVVDPLSFYCAFGEAMNGPGGYYGFTLDSLEDCFYGGFGATSPFTLHLINGDFNELREHKAIENNDLLKLQRIEELLISKEVTLVRDTSP